jgi:hypothetical protein
MRKITQESVDAFMNAREFKKANMEVEVLPNVTILRLHGNAIAYRYNDPERTLSITNAGWQSNTTKERLNAIPDVSIHQKNWVWYLNGEEWDGSLIDVSVNVQQRLEEIRKSLDNENISYGELAELYYLREHIDEGDVQLREASGIPEFSIDSE